MKLPMTRRELMQLMAAAGLGSVLAGRAVAAEESDLPPPDAPAGKFREKQLIPTPATPRYPAALSGGKVVQPERPLSVIHETDVLVIGGGPAGFAAAVSAARTGVKVAIVERYGCFGGQWTGGMVLPILSTHAKPGGKMTKVLRGIGDEILQRLAKVEGGVVGYGEDKPNPSSDPEATMYMIDEMVVEAGVKVYFHCWVADVIMEGPVVRGVVIESKAGRQALVGKVVIDATGDGDVFAAAGADFEMRLHAVGLVHRLGNIDRIDKAKMKDAAKPVVGGKTPIPSVNWVNMRGPVVNCLDVAELSRLQLEERRAIWTRTQKLRAREGAEQVYLLNTASQIGVRCSRLLVGMQQLTYKDSLDGKKFADVVGVGGMTDAVPAGWPIPYGTMVPKKLDGLLAAGRCISVDEKLIEGMRLIAPCLVTGHAAGAAAAVAVQTKCQPRNVEIAKVQKLLTEQGAYLG